MAVRPVFIGLIVLLATVTMALIGAFGQYFTIGEFFQFQDVLHHETFEVVAIAFGVGVFFTALAFDFGYRSQKLYLVRQPMTAVVLSPTSPYSQIMPYAAPNPSIVQSPMGSETVPQQRRRY